VKQAAQRLAAATAGVLGASLGPRTPAAAGILLYHRVAPRPAAVPAPSWNVTPPCFERQLAGLLARGFHAWPLGRLLEHHRQGRAVPPATFVVTFDDGYESVYRHAWPVLRALDVPATLFLSTAYLDGDAPFPFDRWAAAHRGGVPSETFRPLRAWQCEAMARSGLVTLGAHTHTHRDLRDDPGEFGRDLQRSVDVLRARFGVREVDFAYPFGKPSAGHCGPPLADAARRTGVRCALTTESRTVDVRTDPYRWGRFNVYPFDTARTVAGKLAGWYDWIAALQSAGRLRVAARALGTGPRPLPGRGSP
jgi:peptidoglycan/xylan/chitin deacetylase (PgdA/CDA1 family)